MLRNRMMRGAGYSRPQPPLLLDTYSGAAAAYSLRKLRTDYGGAAIRVRRSSDSAEQDIGFVSGVLDTASLLSFVGAGNGFVTTWYDQSGNSRDATQATAASQPKIVSSGSVILDGSTPVLSFDGNDRLQTAAFTVNQPVSFAVVASAENALREVIFDGRQTAVALYRFENDQKISMAAGALFSEPTVSDGARKLISGLYNGVSSVLRKNGAQLSTGEAGFNQLDGLSIGNARGVPNPVATGFELTGNIQELIFWGANQTANWSGIESNINAHYAIY